MTLFSKDFAVGDSVADDTQALRYFFERAALTGREARLEAGLYRITDTVHIGLPNVTSYEWVADAQGEVPQTAAEAAQIVPNLQANGQKYYPVTINAEPGAVIVADFQPTHPTPAIAYNVGSGGGGKGRITGQLNIATPEVVFNGRVGEMPQDWRPANKIIGLWAYLPRLKMVENINFRGLGYGFCSWGLYWSALKSMTAHSCGRGFVIAGANAQTIEGLEAFFCDLGGIIAGDALSVNGFHTENCKSDLYIPKSDSSTFANLYLEDTNNAAGAGEIALRIGETENGNEMTHCTLTTCRVASVRPGKLAARIWAARGLTVENSRKYEGEVEVDNASYGTAINSPILGEQPDSKWLKIGSEIRGAARGGGSPWRHDGKWSYLVPAENYGAIPANSVIQRNFSLPGGIPTGAGVSMRLTPFSGSMDDRMLSFEARQGAPGQAVVYIANKTATDRNFSGALILQVDVFGG